MLDFIVTIETIAINKTEPHSAWYRFCSASAVTTYIRHYINYIKGIIRVYKVIKNEFAPGEIHLEKIWEGESNQWNGMTNKGVPK